VPHRTPFISPVSHLFRLPHFPIPPPTLPRPRAQSQRSAHLLLPPPRWIAAPCSSRPIRQVSFCEQQFLARARTRNGVHVQLDASGGGGGEGPEAEARGRGGADAAVRVADAARARDLLVQAPGGDPPRARGALRRRRRRGGPDAQQGRARGGRPRARGRGARAHALEPRHPRVPPLPPPPGRAPRAPSRPRVPASAPRRLRGEGHRRAAAGGEEGHGAGPAGARLPEAVVSDAPRRDHGLHRGAPDAGPRHDGPRRGAVRRLLIIFRRRLFPFLLAGVTNIRGFVVNFFSVYFFPRPEFFLGIS
jgi:hypothetical protein